MRLVIVALALLVGAGCSPTVNGGWFVLHQTVEPCAPVPDVTPAVIFPFPKG